MQDIEFTIERGKLWISNKNSKRTAFAALRIASEMIERVDNEKKAYANPPTSLNNYSSD